MHHEMDNEIQRATRWFFVRLSFQKTGNESISISVPMWTIFITDSEWANACGERGSIQWISIMTFSIMVKFNGKRQTMGMTNLSVQKAYRVSAALIVVQIFMCATRMSIPEIGPLFRIHAAPFTHGMRRKKNRKTDKQKNLLCTHNEIMTEWNPNSFFWC